MGMEGSAYAVWLEHGDHWDRSKKTGAKLALINWAEDWALDPPAEVNGLAVVPAMLPVFNGDRGIAVWIWVRGAGAE